MRFAITGAAGLVGRHVVRECLRGGHDVIAFVRRRDSAPFEAHHRLAIYEWEMDGGPVPAGLPLGADVLVHLAAYVPPRMDDESLAERCFQVNALAMTGLVQAAARAGVRHLVHASTGALYVPLQRPAREDDPVYPASRAPFYLVSKLAGEVFAAHAANRADARLTILRIASVYGPGMKSGSVLDRFMKQSAVGEPHRVADASYAADFVWVGDVARAAMSVGEVGAAGVFNVGSGVFTTIPELSHAVQCTYGLASPEDKPTPPDILTGFPALDVSRAVERLGYAPTSLMDGLRELSRTG